MSERTTQSDTPPSRREFLLVSGTAVSASWSYAAELEALIRPPTFVARVRRDRDLLQLELAFIGFREKDGLLIPTPGNRSLVAVHFPPQNLAEALFERKDDPNAEHQPLPLVGGPNSNSPVPPIRSYLSGPSRIVFEAPAGARFQVRCPAGKKRNRSIVDEWLAELAGWKLHIPPEAGQLRFAPRLPRLDETCLEIPYRVMLSPRSAEARWLTPSDRMPFDESRAGVSELWNAELMSRKPLLPAKPGEDLGALDPNLAPLADVSLQATAVYSPDHRKIGEPGAGEYYPGNQELSLLSLTRHRLVHQMSGLSDPDKKNGPAGGGWVDIDHLVLTALGATGFLSYFNPKSFATIIAGQIAEFQKNKLGPPPPETVSSELMVWKHRMVVGRDVYFVEAYFGVLFPMVYPCIFVKLTERQFASRVIKEPAVVGPPGAYLLTRRYIVVRENERNFTDSDTPLGRSMPMKSVALGWTQTPDLQPEDSFPIDKDLQTPNSYAPGATKPLVFVPRPINGPKTSEALRWPVTMTDESGRQAKTDDACLLFANHVILGHQAWEGLQHKFREWSLPPQPVALAPETPYLTDPAGRHHDLQNAERDGAGRLGEAVRTWQAVAGDEFQSQFDRLLRGRDLRPLLPALATLEAIERELRPLWKELHTSPPLAQLLREDFLKAEVFGGDVAAAVGAFLAKYQPRIEGNVEEIRSRIRRGAEQVLASLNRLEQSTLDALKRHLAVVNTAEMLRDIHAQLGRAEKIASLLETHAVVFGSRLVDSLYSHAPDGVVSKLMKIWEKEKDGAEFVKQGLGILKTFPKPEHAKLVAAMDTELRALAEAPQAKVTALAKQYVEQLEAARTKAGKLGSNVFHAVLEQASGIIPSMKSIDPNYPVEKIIFTGGYLARGIREAGNGVFAQVVRTAEELDKIKKLAKVGSDAIKNGLASPKALIQGISTELGAVAAETVDGLKTIAKGFGKENAVALQNALAGAIPDMKLFGSFNLNQLIDKILPGKLPVINQLKLPEVLQHTWKWTLPIKPKLDVLIVKYRSEPRDNPGNVCLHIEIVTTTRLPKAEEILAGKKPEGSVTLDAYLGRWDNASERPDPPPKVADPATGSSFSITLLELVEVYFRQVRVEARYALGGSAKPKVTPEIVTVDFVGPLKFVKDLQEKLGNLGGGFKLAITPNFLEMSYEFLIPPISFGAFSMRNIRIGAGLMLPFGDDPLRFRFNFSSFAVPFELTVMAFGGRGFLRVELDTGGGRLLEGALEFGGSLAFDVGVASGGLYVMAGAYFKITQSSTSLSGYIRAGGTLSVLGLIHASVEFLLMVTYREFEGGNELYGTATLTVSIEFLFFSIDVNITMEKRIAGSDSKKPGTALLESDRLMSIGARQPMPAVRPRGENRPAYFARPGIPGRFAWDENNPARSAARWNSEYWSQFDYR